MTPSLSHHPRMSCNANFAGSGIFLVWVSTTHRQHLFISCQGEQGEVLTVHLVFELENAGESGAGCVIFRPASVWELGADEVFDSAFDACIATGAEAHECPCGLAGGAWAEAFERGEIVEIGVRGNRGQGAYSIILQLENVAILNLCIHRRY